MKENQISLSYKEGSSDKVYQVALEPANKSSNDLWVVNFAYGRRGAAMQTGTKTQKPVNFDQAVKIMSKLVVEKQSKGYIVDSTDGSVSIPKPVDKVQTGFYSQLLKPIEETEVDDYIEDDDYIAQEKMDGERRKLQKLGGKIIGINRKAQVVSLPLNIIEDLTIRTHYDNFVLDGEQIGDKFHAFDLLVFQADIQSKGYMQRYQLLKELVGDSNFQHIQLVKAVSGFVPKSKLHRELLQAGKEGIVFKHRDAKYIPGRNSGTQFKRKFYETASFLVTGINEQRSVQISVMADAAVLPVGNVTVPVNHQIPKLNDIIEVRYLYAYRGGSIIQPVYLGVRTDLEKADCSVSQLKYKGEPQDDEESN